MPCPPTKPVAFPGGESARGPMATSFGRFHRPRPALELNRWRFDHNDRSGCAGQPGGRATVPRRKAGSRIPLQLDEPAGDLVSGEAALLDTHYDHPAAGAARRTTSTSLADAVRHRLRRRHGSGGTGFLGGVQYRQSASARDPPSRPPGIAEARGRMVADRPEPHLRATLHSRDRGPAAADRLVQASRTPVPRWTP